MGGAARPANLLPRRLGIRIETIARRLLRIRRDKPLQDLRVRPLKIVRAKGQQFGHPSHLTFSKNSNFIKIIPRKKDFVEELTKYKLNLRKVMDTAKFIGLVLSKYG